MRPGPWSLAPVVGSFGIVCLATAASADPAPVGWDVAAEAGVAKRFTTRGASDAPHPDAGVAFELQGHVALLPMLRVGVYAVHDISPASGIAARQFWAGGLHFKATPPLMVAPWRVWVFAGFGYGSSYAPSYSARVGPVPGEAAPEVRVQGVSGSLLEAPFGVGLGYRVRRPWELFAELGGRFGIEFWGAMYNDGATRSTTPAAMAQPFAGNDSFALSFSLGVSLSE